MWARGYERSAERYPALFAGAGDAAVITEASGGCSQCASGQRSTDRPDSAPQPVQHVSPFTLRASKLVLLAVLAVFVCVRGIVPALRGIENDFPGYFTAARIVADGGDTSRLYDTAWFRDQVRRYGMEDARNPAKFAPFPPPTALLLLPLTRLKPLTALRVVVAVSVLSLMLSIFLLARSLSWDPLDAALYILASGLGILSGLRYGQPYILISMFCLLGYYLYLTGRPWLAGLALGVFVPIKYFPVVVPAGLTLRREWKVVVGSLIAIADVALVSIGVLGWPVHQTFLRSVLGNHLTGQLSLHEHTLPFTAVYQSFDSLIDRLLVFDPTWNPQPLLDAPEVRIVALVAIKAVIVLVAAATVVGLVRREARAAAPPAIGILGILVLLVAPATATYTFVLLWLPVALLVEYFLTRHESLAARLVLATYVLIGFIPYGHTGVFEGHGGLSVLAFPRLFLMLAMFIVSVWSIVRPRGSSPRSPSQTRGAGPLSTRSWEGAPRAHRPPG
jgi:hypothetical protein